MSQNLNEKKRLLEALEYIDDAMISDTLSRVKPEALIRGGQHEPKKRVMHVKQIALIAACALLLGAVMPVVSFVLPRLGVIGGNAGAASDPISESDAEATIDMSQFADMSERDLIEHVGEVPDEFADIVNKNLFANIWVSGEKIIKKSDVPCDYDIDVYDLYGKLLHRIDIKGDVPEYSRYNHKIHSLSDGSYLFVIPYNSPYQGETTDARVIRFDEDGNIIFNTKLDITNSICEFEFFYETDDSYLLISGTYQKSDSYYVKLDKFGNVLKNIHMGGAEEDRLYWIYYTDGELVAYMREHNLAEHPIDILEVTMDEDFNILEKVKTDYHYPADTLYPKFRQLPSGSWDVRNFVLGYSPQMNGDTIPATGGDVSAVIEYDDFVLIISEHDTKWFEYVPWIYSTIPTYTETVYTAHALDGTILWRTAVDSTDYNRLAAIKQEYKEEQERFEEWRKEQTDIE